MYELLNQAYKRKRKRMLHDENYVTDFDITAQYLNHVIGRKLLPYYANFWDNPINGEQPVIRISWKIPRIIILLGYVCWLNVDPNKLE